MRSLTIAALALALAAPAFAADEKQPAKPAAAAPTIDADRALNAIGLSFARRLETLDLSKVEQDKVIAGMREGLSGKAKQKLDQDAQQNIEGFAKVRFNAYLQKQKAKGDAFVKEKAKQKGAITTAGGAVVVPVKDGTGANPTATDTVKVHYVGTLTDGTEFDSSRKRGQPLEFGLGNVVRCWTEGIQKIKVGGHAMVYCPADLAYGERPPPGSVIPPNAALTFDVELLDIVKAPPPPPATPATPAQPKK
jgi:FKBP-type peptidyl-prolyl cis-trans isomerase